MCSLIWGYVAPVVEAPGKRMKHMKDHAFRDTTRAPLRSLCGTLVVHNPPSLIVDAAGDREHCGACEVMANRIAAGRPS